jgi:hypothetical protein
MFHGTMEAKLVIREKNLDVKNIKTKTTLKVRGQNQYKLATILRSKRRWSI